MNLILYIVDDHSLLATTLGEIIETFDIIKKVSIHFSPSDFLKQFEVEVPDVVIVDYEMPEMDGLQLSEIITSKYPETKIIMLSMHDNYRLIYEAMEIGIHSFLLKNTDIDEVKLAIEMVVKNDFYNNELTAIALRRGAKANKLLSNSSQINTLTQREKEILTYICDEFTMKEISEKLILSENTIKNHRQNLQKKLQVNNPVGLVKKAVETGFYKI